MNKKLTLGLITFLLLAALTTANAQERRFEREQEHRFEREREMRPHPDAHWHSEGGWLLPAIVGGALVYEANQYARPPARVFQIQPGQPQLPPPGYHWAQINDASCQCVRIVLMPN